MRFLFLAILITLGISNIFGQSLSKEELQEKINIHLSSNYDDVLFVHTDKTIYTNNETIWFGGYLLRSRIVNFKDHNILSVSLVNEISNKIVLKNVFALQDGLSHGSLTLPDSIPPGNYQFIAYTNVLKDKKPLAIFTQPITIKSITQQDFNAEINLLDTIAVSGLIRAKINVSVKEYDPKERIMINYSVDKEVEQAILLKRGEFSQIISIKQEQIQKPNPHLLTSIKYKGSVQYLNIKLPTNPSKYFGVKFFPESGNMITGLNNRIAWEVLNSEKNPVSVTGILYKNEEAIDTISTNTYGVGTFNLNPDNNSIYKIRLQSGIENNIDYHLPKPNSNGIIINMNEAIVNDTLKVGIRGNKFQNIQIIIHNYKKIHSIINTNAGIEGKNLQIALGPLIPRGINTITVLDTSGRPLAERLFLAHYNANHKTSIKTDKSSYRTKENVSLNINLTSNKGKPLDGIVSIAVVQENRLESSKVQDIESYFYLNHELGKLPQNPHGRGIDSKEYLEDILLVRGWRRYTWQSVTKSIPEDTIKATFLKLRGNVFLGNKPLKKTTSIGVLRDSTFNLITTDNDGSFELNNQNSLTTEGRKLLLTVAEKFNAGYIIEVKNPFDSINQKLTKQLETNSWNSPSKIQSTLDQELKGFEKTIALQTVIVNANKEDNSIYGTNIKKGRNECGDYVCQYNILNCSNHTSGRNPIQGESYTKQGGGIIVYEGCSNEKKSPTLFRIDGIYNSKEFYGVNTDVAGLIEPQLISTIYWKTGLIIKNGQVKCNFNTGDITGGFKLIVQGIGESDLIYGESSIIVKK